MNNLSTQQINTALVDAYSAVYSTLIRDFFEQITIAQPSIQIDFTTWHARPNNHENILDYDQEFVIHINGTSGKLQLQRTGYPRRISFPMLHVKKLKSTYAYRSITHYRYNTEFAATDMTAKMVADLIVALYKKWQRKYELAKAKNLLDE